MAAKWTLSRADLDKEEGEGKKVVKITVATGSEKPRFKKKYGMAEKGWFIRVGPLRSPCP